MIDIPLEKVTPYIGLIPYAERDAPFFFGRERERAIVTANLMAARLTILYGPSGAGKTSVLRAGVEHALREQAQQNLEEHGEPELAVIVFGNWRDDPIAGLSLAVQQAVKPTLAAMNQAGDGSPDPHELMQNLKMWSNRLNGELLIILDQFEEYFLYHAQEDGEGTFAVEFPRAVNSTELRVNFLVSLREDALSKLDRFKGRIPNLFDNYLRIEHLTQEAARDAIEQPLEEYNRRQTNESDRVTIEPALVNTVLSQVQTGRMTLAREGSGGVGDNPQQVSATIETSYLQLVMTRLWEVEGQAGSDTLRLATLERLQGAEHIVRTHLDSVLGGLSSSESEIAADVFRYLVTPSGTKIAYTVKDLAAYTNTAGAQLTPVLERLTGSGFRILRTVDPPPDQPRETRYEIFHDVLASAILDWRGRYMQEKDRRGFEQRLAEEARAEQQRAEEQRRQNELEAEAKASRSLRRLATALVLVSLIAFAAAVLAVAGWTQAESAVSRLNTLVNRLLEAAQMSGVQAASAQATAQAAAAQASALQATADAGVSVPAATATAQAAAARAAATQASDALATAQAAFAQATTQAAAAQEIGGSLPPNVPNQSEAPSPKIIFARGSVGCSVVVMRNLDTGEETIFRWADNTNEPTWSPDGRQFVASSGACTNQNNSLVLFTPAEKQSARIDGDNTIDPDWGSDNRIYFTRGSATSNGEIYSVRPDGSDERRTGLSGRRPALSPDQRHLAFMQQIDGVWHILVADNAGDGRFVNARQLALPSIAQDQHSRMPHWVDTQNVVFNVTDGNFDSVAIATIDVDNGRSNIWDGSSPSGQKFARPECGSDHWCVANDPNGIWLLRENNGDFTVERQLTDNIQDYAAVLYP